MRKVLGLLVALTMVLTAMVWMPVAKAETVVINSVSLHDVTTFDPSESFSVPATVEGYFDVEFGAETDASEVTFTVAVYSDASAAPVATTDVVVTVPPILPGTVADNSFSLDITSVPDGTKVLTVKVLYADTVYASKNIWRAVKYVVSGVPDEVLKESNLVITNGKVYDEYSGEAVSGGEVRFYSPDDVLKFTADVASDGTFAINQKMSYEGIWTVKYYDGSTEYTLKEIAVKAMFSLDSPSASDLVVGKTITVSGSITDGSHAPHHIYVDFYDGDSLITTYDLSVAADGSFLARVDVPGFATTMKVRTADEGTYWNGLVYAKMDVNPLASQVSVLNGKFYANGHDAVLKVAAKDAAGHNLAGDLYYKISVTPGDYSAEDVVSGSGVYSITIPGSALEEPGTVYVTVKEIRAGGKRYAGGTFTVPIVDAVGVEISGALADAVVGSTNITVSAQRADALVDGKTLAIYGGLVKAPAYTDIDLPAVEDGISLGEIMKVDGALIGSTDSNYELSVSVPVEFKEGGVFKAIFYAVLIDEDGSIVYASDPLVIEKAIDGYIVSEPIKVTVGDSVDLKITVTDVNGNPINNAVVEVRGVGSVLKDCDYASLVLSPERTNIVGGVYDFSSYYADECDFTAANAGTITVYVNGGDKVNGVPAVVVNPKEDLGVEVSFSGEVKPGYTALGKIVVSGADNGTYKIKAGSTTIISGSFSNGKATFSHVFGAGDYTVEVVSADGNHIGYGSFTVNAVDIKVNAEAFTKQIKSELDFETTYGDEAYNGYTAVLKVYNAKDEAIDFYDGDLASVSELEKSILGNKGSFVFAAPADAVYAVLTIEKGDVVVGQKEFELVGATIDAGVEPGAVIGYAGTDIPLNITVKGAGDQPLAGRTVVVGGVAGVDISGTTNDEGIFSASIYPLGTGNLTVKVLMDVGDPVAASYVIAYDTTAPSVSITAPKLNVLNTYETDEDAVEIVGEVTDNETGPAKVYINGQEIPLVGGGFSYIATLREGVNIFNVVAYDKAGNASDPFKFQVVYNPNLGKIVIELAPGSQFYKVNGETKIMDVAPFISDAGRTMVPVRFIAEALGLTVDWNAEKRQVTITGENTQIILTIDSKQAMINGVPVQLDVAPVIVNGRTFVPLRFVAETFDFQVDWQPPVVILIKEL